MQHIIRSESIEKPYPSGHRGRAGSSSVAGAGDAGVDLVGAAGGGDEGGSGDVGGDEEMVAVAIGPEEGYEVEGRNKNRPPPPHPSVPRPRSAS